MGRQHSPSGPLNYLVSLYQHSPGRLIFCHFFPLSFSEELLFIWDRASLILVCHWRDFLLSMVMGHVFLHSSA